MIQIRSRHMDIESGCFLVRQERIQTLIDQMCVYWQQRIPTQGGHVQMCDWRMAWLRVHRRAFVEKHDFHGLQVSVLGGRQVASFLSPLLGELGSRSSVADR